MEGRALEGRVEGRALEGHVEGRALEGQVEGRVLEGRAGMKAGVAAGGHGGRRAPRHTSSSAAQAR